MSSRQQDFALNELKLPSSKVVASRWPVDTKFWRPMDRETNTVCSVGREMRDYGTLVKAIHDLNIPCHIAAGGTMNTAKPDQWIKDLAEWGSLPTQITIGRKGYLELRELYACSRFLVVPMLETETDNGSTSILEAMAMGKAVICSRTEGQRDIIQEGKTGLFVPVGNVKALREAVIHLWNNPAEAERMGREARKFVQEHHALELFLGAVRQAVMEAIEAHKQ
jgi:glycosyltransferase involved in cell wall biosynthesis